MVVAGSSVESISVADRVAWLAATHAGEPHVRVVGDLDDAPVDYDDDAAWVAHTAFFAAAAARSTLEQGLDPAGAVVDAVFSSEPYGAELARRLGAVHVVVDHARLTHPVSGTAVRADTPASWAHLSPAVRAGLALRVVVIGAESTGTTTLARDLSAHLAARGGALAGTRCVPEHGRDYSASKLEAARHQATAVGAPEPRVEDLVWTPGDFVHIATRQRDLEDAAARAGSPVLVCDTDAFATGVWLRRYLGTGLDVAPWAHEVSTVADSREHALYLLTDHVGVDFEQDGTRDGEHIRADMTGWFVHELTRTGRQFVWMRGSRDARVCAAALAVDTLMTTAWTWSAPLSPKDAAA